MIGPGHYVYTAIPTGDITGTESCEADFFAGTSYSTPIVAGVTVLVRQYFTDGYYPSGVSEPSNKFLPMGALLKAILINSGRKLRIADYQKVVVDKYHNVSSLLD